jgi:Family of unknown function (DUF5682)
MAAAVRILGVRHHSPACARLVAHTIERDRPQAVLIEGPSDFNGRIGELLLDHTLPLALYSFADADGRAAQCWFPMLDYSPEWIALRRGQDSGALLRFIDLPHWQYRAVPDAQRATAGNAAGRTRYGEVTAALCRRFGCDGDDALWDHLFESLLPAALDDLALRLNAYFAELRGDDPGTEQDRVREDCMARWVAWAAAHHERVLVVCGGWHQPALERAWPTLTVADEPPAPQAPDPRRAGCYLVPYEFRRVDALGGYRSGMPSPMFYQWAWEHGAHAAARRALKSMVTRLRQRQLPVSTADLLALEQQSQSLARLRGHEVPLRVDLLDGLQSALVKEALETPPPWSDARLLHVQHHPLLREALLALTGDGFGRLDAATTQPPLLRDVQERLAACALEPTRSGQPLVLDRRRETDVPRARLLWQLVVLGIGGARLKELKAPQAARALSNDWRYEEHWTLVQDERWFPDLIEASVHGATLDAASRQCLLRRVAQAEGIADALAKCLLLAVRAGLFDLGRELAQQLRDGLAASHDHGALAQAARSLAELVQAGFWGDDPRALLEDTLAAIGERLLWLLEGRDGPGSAAQLEADVRAVSVFDALLPLELPALDRAFVLETMARLARSAGKPPSLRGAALGVAYAHGGLGDGDAARAEVLATTRAMPARDALGDFLYGLFACARALATESDSIVRAVHIALDAVGHEDFLVALPPLRAAFGWFPPRERGAIAAHVARLLGLNSEQRLALTTLREGAGALLDAKRIEAQALQWAREFGLLE